MTLEDSVGKIRDRVDQNKVDVKYGTASVGTSSTTIAHGLGRTPKTVQATPWVDARVWRSAAPDATNIYLQASASTSVYWEVK